MKHVTLIARSVAVAALLGACSDSEEFDVTPEEARDELLVLLEDTQDALGAEFEVRDDPTPITTCKTLGGFEGTNYTFQRFGPAPDSQDAALETVRDLWEGWGYNTREVEMGPAVILEARPEHDAYVEFGATTSSMDLRGRSGCIPPADG